jgi:hypothetical protein
MTELFTTTRMPSKKPFGWAAQAAAKNALAAKIQKHFMCFISVARV